MTEIERNLPDYDKPPVIETLLGVRFSSLKPFTTRLFGLYRDYVKEQFPHFEIQDPIGRATEEFGSPRVRKSGIEIMTSPNFRCWYIDPTETKLIQLQADGFYHNWRKVKESDSYFHYADLKLKFDEHWLHFRKFLKDQGATEPEVEQCEITYINHIDKGQEWQSYGQLNRVISVWSGKYSGSFLGEPESVNLNVQYILPNQMGRLHVTMQPAIRRADAKEILQLTLTARGKPKTSRLEDLTSWFDLGHVWIVKGFTDFTATSMHDTWRRKL